MSGLVEACIDSVDPVVRNFDSALTPDQRAHIRLVPTGDGGYQVERTYPAPHHLAGGATLDRETIERHDQAAGEHFAWLREAGLVIPHLRSRTLDRHMGGAALLSIAKYVPAESFGMYHNWHLLGPRARHQEQAAKLARVLIDYHDWVATEKKDTMLHDIQHLTQWGVTPDGGIVLHDTDPLMRDLDHTAVSSRQTIRGGLMNIHNWAQFIQPTETGEELIAHIDDAVAQHKLARTW